MKRIVFLTLVATMAMGTWAETVTIPTALGSTIVYTNANVTTMSGITLNDGGNWGSVNNDEWAQMTIRPNEAGDYVLVFKSGTANDNVAGNDPRAVVSLNGNILSTCHLVRTGNAWTPVTLHAVELKNLAAATDYTLRWDFKVNSGYVGNFGAIAVYSKSDFDSRYVQTIPQADNVIALNNDYYRSLADCSIESSNVAIGSTHANSNLRLTLRNETEQAYTLAMKSAVGSGEAQFEVTIRRPDGSVVYNQQQKAPTTSNWTPSTQHLLHVGQLPAGVLTLDIHMLSTTNTNGYAGNYGDIALYAASAYDAAHVVKIPLTVDGKIHLGTYGGSTENYCLLTNCGVDNSGDGYVIGSTHGNTKVLLKIKNETEQEYILNFQTGANDCSSVLNVRLFNGQGNAFSTTRTVPNLGTWSLNTQHRFSIGTLPVGYYTLEITVASSTGSYAGNWGNFSLWAATD